jgi:predicted AAA+ superfamily ATPase
MYIRRSLQDEIKNWMFKGKVIILYGARQVGKTTLVKKILDEHENAMYVNCEHYRVREVLESKNLEQIKSYLGNNKLIVFDEAQKIKDIGELLKLIKDSFPEYQIIATGSSSFELSNEITEALTGRNVKFILFPFSLSELASLYSAFELDDRLESFLRFGMYPDIVERPENEKSTLLDMLSNDYLFRDVLKHENLKQPDLLVGILKALALQLGSEVSFRELSGLLKTSVETLQRYLEILERSFVIFHLTSFSRNLRNELARKRKYYFYDIGIRNSIIQNLNSLSNRADIGGIWENFCIVERMKCLQKAGLKANFYFWRTYQQNEIDFIEETGGVLRAFEFKWNPKAKVKIPKLFLETYPESTFEVINRDNFIEKLIACR